MGTTHPELYSNGAKDLHDDRETFRLKVEGIIVEMAESRPVLAETGLVHRS